MGLKGYILRRALDSLVTLFLIFLINFFIFFTRMEAYSGMTQTQQFVEYLKFVFIDHFGTVGPPISLRTVDYVFSGLSSTISLLIFSFSLIFLFSLVFGAVAAYKFGKFPDLIITSVLIFVCMIPAWWLGLMIMKMGPSFLGINALNPQYFVVKQQILPSLAVLFCLCGIFFLIVRNSMVNIFPENFVTLAKVKGVSLKSLLFKHVMRNALLAITAMFALAPFLIVNQLMPIERVFNVPGIGNMLFDSLISRTGYERIPLESIQLIFLTLAVLIIGAHFILDVSQHVLDPRLKYPTAVTDGGIPKRLRRKLVSRKRRLGLFWRNFKKGKSGLIGLAILSFFIIAALLSPILPIADPEKVFPPTYAPQPPSPYFNTLLTNYFFSGDIKICFLSRMPRLPSHWLGTDEYGRDVLSRIVWGTRVSLFEGIAATSLAMLIGCFIGLIAGYYQGRWFAYLLDRITEVFLSMPILIFIIFFPLQIGDIYYDIRAVFRWVLAVGVSTWAITAKLVRSQVILAKEKPSIEAAKAIGANDRHILWHYVLPEAIPVMVSSVVYIATIVLAMQSTLDYFGFRRNWWSHSLDAPALKSAPYVSWGTILSYGTINASLFMPWWTLLPAAFCIALLGLSMVLISNKVADALNPEL